MVIIHCKSHLTDLQSCEFPFYIMLIKVNQTTVTAFCENSKVVSSNFSITKSIVFPVPLSNLPIKLTCCFKSGYFDSISLLKSIPISL